MTNEAKPQHANSDKEMVKERIVYKAVYLGAGPVFVNQLDLFHTRGYMRVHLGLTTSNLEIPEMSLKIPYKRISDLQIVKDEKEITVRDFLWYGWFWIALKKRKRCMKLTYEGEDDIEQNLFFYVKEIDEVEPALWERVSHAHRSS